MRYFFLVLLAVSTPIFCANVREFPFDATNQSVQENKTFEDLTTAVSEVLVELSKLEKEANKLETEDYKLDKQVNGTAQTNLSWRNEASPILSVLRNFWTQASVSLMDPIDQILEEPTQNNQIIRSNENIQNEQVFRAIQQGLIEATTMLINELELTTLPTIQDNESEPKKQEHHKQKQNKQEEMEREQIKSETNKLKQTKPEQTKSEHAKSEQIKSKPKIEEIKPEKFTKRQGDRANDSEAENLATNKPMTLSDLIANLSTSCSNCYEKLNTCVQKCFADNNCNDVQRQVRICPPVPSRSCSTFILWNPVDECQNHSDCQSPLLCCSDGCANKCLPGVWSS